MSFLLGTPVGSLLSSGDVDTLQLVTDLLTLETLPKPWINYAAAVQAIVITAIVSFAGGKSLE